jgi:PAS domain S-box-containing protein
LYFFALDQAAILIENQGSRVPDGYLNAIALLNSSKEPVWMVNTAYQLVLFNQVFAQWFIDFFGIDLEANKLFKLTDLLNHPHFNALVEPALYARAFACERFSEEVTVYHPYCGQMYLRIDFNPIIDIQGRVAAVGVFCYDFHSRRYVEEFHQTSQKLLDISFNQSSDALMIIEADSFKLLNWNRRACELLGLNESAAFAARIFPHAFPPKFGQWLQKTLLKIKQGQVPGNGMNWHGETEIPVGWGSGAIQTLVTEGNKLFYIRFTDITTQKNAEMDLARQRQLHQTALLQATVEAQEKTCRRISRDLHDGLGQLLTAARFNLQALIQQQINQLSTEAKQIIDSIQKLLEDAVHETRTLSHSLMPRLLVDFGLVPAIENLCKQLAPGLRPRINFQVHHFTQRLPAEYEIALYRIIQELLNNAIKYSQAGTIDIQIFYTMYLLTVIVEDDGIGFEISDSRLTYKGAGIANIESRIQLLGGQFTIDSAPGSGTIAVIEIPLELKK